MTGAYDCPWLWFPTPRPTAPVRLICLPYAGGSAAVFRDWPASLSGAEVAIVRLPGRERRFTEAPIRDFDTLLDALAHGVEPARDRPLALFGHSLGGILAFELARRMSTGHGSPPVRLFVSGCTAPQLFAPEPTNHLSDAAFVDHLRASDFLPEARTAQPDVLELMLPSIRADFAAAETYSYRPGPPLTVPVHGYCGAVDRHVTEEAMTHWQEQAAGGFSLDVLPGDHFFLHAERQRLLRGVDARLRAAAYR